MTSKRRHISNSFVSWRRITSITANRPAPAADPYEAEAGQGHQRQRRRLRHSEHRLPGLSPIDAQLGKDVKKAIDAELAAGQAFDRGFARGGQRRRFSNRKRRHW